MKQENVSFFGFFFHFFGIGVMGRCSAIGLKEIYFEGDFLYSAFFSLRRGIYRSALLLSKFSHKIAPERLTDLSRSSQHRPEDKQAQLQETNTLLCSQARKHASTRITHCLLF